jgi:hypothetical protein
MTDEPDDFATEHDLPLNRRDAERYVDGPDWPGWEDRYDRRT